uniref:Uncharacterized protein n=1 Tax=Arion vulgaris TaxID=1028688 RepID=A0A0B6Z641_9EUPU
MLCKQRAHQLSNTHQLKHYQHVGMSLKFNSQHGIVKVQQNYTHKIGYPSEQSSTSGLFLP